MLEEAEVVLHRIRREAIVDPQPLTGLSIPHVNRPDFVFDRRGVRGDELDFVLGVDGGTTRSEVKSFDRTGLFDVVVSVSGLFVHGG